MSGEMLRKPPRKLYYPTRRAVGEVSIGGVPFKYQRQVEDLKPAAHMAANYVDI